MNITPQSNQLPITTAVNLQTDSLRRDNQQREIITKPEPLSQSAAEKGVASDKERGRTPAQNNQQVDFASLRKQAERANDVIGNGGGNDERSGQDSAKNSDQEAKQQNSDGSVESKQGQETSSRSQQSSTEALAEKEIIRSLESRDKEVRNHERAHASVGGAYTGAPTYAYETGPNGKKYAVEGEVSVDLTPIAGDPKETIAKMNKVQAAALAPANPSSQDVRVAASASGIILEAQAELINANANANANAENTEETPKEGNLFRDKDLLQSDVSFESNESSQAFDRQIEQTLSAQEAVVPSRPITVDQRAGRIEQFYSNINQAYEKSASYQFELTA
jgi:hypothetical protein